VYDTALLKELEVAERLPVSGKTLHRWVKAGKFPQRVASGGSPARLLAGFSGRAKGRTKQRRTRSVIEPLKRVYIGYKTGYFIPAAQQ